MKTAVSVPNALYAKAEKYAKAHKISRSELYQEALQSYLSENTQTDVTRQLNAVYTNENLALAPEVAKMQARTIKQDNESW